MNKKKLLSILVSFFLMYNNEALSSNDGYSKEYKNGTVYIGNKEYLESLDDICENDLLVLDARNDEDPNMKVYASHLINDPLLQKEILEILLEYEDNDPSLWDRSLESMQREWYIHNLMVMFSYKLERTSDVDFNNGDEEKYKVEYWKRKILK